MCMNSSILQIAVWKKFHNVIFISKLTLTNKQPRTSPSKNYKYLLHNLPTHSKANFLFRELEYADKNWLQNLYFSCIFSRSPKGSPPLAHNDKHSMWPRNYAANVCCSREYVSDVENWQHFDFFSGNQFFPHCNGW